MFLTSLSHRHPSIDVFLMEQGAGGNSGHLGVYPLNTAITSKTLSIPDPDYNNII
jgi:hypothetical protein